MKKLTPIMKEALERISEGIEWNIEHGRSRLYVDIPGVDFSLNTLRALERRGLIEITKEYKDRGEPVRRCKFPKWALKQLYKSTKEKTMSYNPFKCDVTLGFVKAMLWATSDGAQGQWWQMGYYVDFGMVLEAEDEYTAIKEYVAKFLHFAEPLIDANDDGLEELVGHCLFLQSQGHGTGFWDREGELHHWKAYDQIVKAIGETECHFWVDEVADEDDETPEFGGWEFSHYLNKANTEREDAVRKAFDDETGRELYHIAHAARVEKRDLTPYEVAILGLFVAEHEDEGSDDEVIKLLK